MRSCEARDKPRTRRPVTISGTTTTGINSRITPMSLALVSPISTSAPTRFKVERSTIDKLTPAMACTSVVSVVRRDSTSPTRVVS